jgi:hypothetical protein
MAKQLVPGAAIVVGITADGYAVYIEQAAAGSSLKAIPIAGGTVVTIAAAFAQTDDAAVSGGAVAVWTGIGMNGVGTFNVWTKANGFKTVTGSNSFDGIFAASTDGTRIVFSVNTPAAATSTSLAVTDSSAPTGTAVLTGNAALNLAAAQPPMAGGNPSCSPDLGFSGAVLYAGYCTGTNAATTTGRLYAVPAGAAPTPQRLDGVGNAGTLVADAGGRFFHADSTGANLFVIQATNNTGAVIKTGAAPTTTTLDANTSTGLLLKDGTAFYHAGTSLVHATLGAGAPTKDALLAAATPLSGLIGLSTDQKHALLAESAPANNLTDIRAIDTTTKAQTPKDIVATSTANPFGFAANDTLVLYGTDPVATGLKLKTRPVGGGTESVLAMDALFAFSAPAATSVVFATNQQMLGTAPNQVTVFDLKYVPTAGGTAYAIGGSVAGVDVSGTTVVFTSLDAKAAGLYAFAMP